MNCYFLFNTIIFLSCSSTVIISQKGKAVNVPVKESLVLHSFGPPVHPLQMEHKNYSEKNK